MFRNNSASDKGGAIYQEFKFEENVCFIKNAGNTSGNIRVNFSDNSITGNSTVGSDIFLPTTSFCSNSSQNFTEALNAIAKFDLNENGTSTSTLHLSFHGPIPVFYPGISAALNIFVRDDLNNQVRPTEQTLFQVKSKSMSIKMIK